MTDDKTGPEEIHILQSDVEYLAQLDDGWADTVVVSAATMYNMQGEPQTVKYIRADIYEAEQENAIAFAVGWFWQMYDGEGAAGRVIPLLADTVLEEYRKAKK